ncbi:MAG: amidase family protein, partial [Hyphomonadaceae bacterium]
MAASRRELLAGGASLALSACGGSERAYAPIAPQPGDALEGLDGVGVVARIRAGDITAAEAAEAAIARAERVQPQLNFIATPAYEMGRLRAAPPPGTPAQQGPLAGLPTFIKDLSPLAGAKFMSGSRAFAENIAARNSPYVEALLAAGVTPLGKTTTPEFGLTATTEPLLTGPTRNPWDAARSSGGSSGGAAVAVAAGVVPVAHGGDGGGSIRIPASCCGLVGLKVSRGRLIDAPADAPVALAVDGCLSRTVRDTAAWIAATERGGQGAPFPLLGLVRGPSQRRLRVGLAVADAAGRAPDPEVAAAVTAAGALCARLGHHVSEVAFDLDAEANTEAFVLYWAAGAAQAAAQVRRNAPNAPRESLLEPLSLQ